MMYRVIAALGGALALAACSSSSMNLDIFKPEPLLDSVRLETVPPGAEAKASNGQTCVTPCALALPTNAPISVTFTLAGYQPDTESLDILQETGLPPRLTPNPLTAELTPAPPPPPVKPKKKAPKKPAAKKPMAAAKKPATAAAAPMPAQAAMPQAASPWPAPPPQR